MPFKVVPLESVNNNAKPSDEMIEDHDDGFNYDDDGNVIFDIQIDKWIATKNMYPSCFVQARIHKYTDRAILVDMWAGVKHSYTCHRCSREITHPASIHLGYGIDCVKKVGLGAAWLDHATNMTPLQIVDARDSIKQATIKTQQWLPLSGVIINGFRGDGYQQWRIFDMIDAAIKNTKGKSAYANVTIAIEEAKRGMAVNRMIVVKCPRRYDMLMADIKDKFKGSYLNKQDMAWYITFNRESAIAIHESLGDAAYDIDEEIQTVVRQHYIEQEAQAFKDMEEFPPIPYVREGFEPWLHQQRAYYFIKDLRSAALFMEMGTGKSAVYVHEVANSADDELFHYIIGPKTVIRSVWKKQFEMHTTRDDIDVIPLIKGTALKKLQDMMMGVATAKRLNRKVVFLVGYQMAFREPLASYMLKMQWNSGLLDESHKIKAPKGAASKFMAKLGQRTTKRRIATGTPMPHSPLDVFSQYRYLDSTIFGTSFTAFKAQYADYIKMASYDKIIGWLNKGQLHEKIYSVAYRVTKRDALPNLPPVTFTERVVALEKKARELYDQMASQLIFEIDNNLVSASNVLVKLLRLQQISSGIVRDDDGVMRRISHAKQNGLEELLDDVPYHQPVPIFCRFTQDINTVKYVAEKLGRKCYELRGGKDELAQWQYNEYADDEAGAFIAVNIQAGGAGVDLTKSGGRPVPLDVYYSVGYSLGDYEQATSRIDRPGQELPVTHVSLVTDNTIDRRIYQALQAKQDIAREILTVLPKMLVRETEEVDTDDDVETYDSDPTDDNWGDK